MLLQHYPKSYAASKSPDDYPTVRQDKNYSKISQRAFQSINSLWPNSFRFVITVHKYGLINSLASFWWSTLCSVSQFYSLPELAEKTHAAATQKRLWKPQKLQIRIACGQIKFTWSSYAFLALHKNENTTSWLLNVRPNIACTTFAT